MTNSIYKLTKAIKDKVASIRRASKPSPVRKYPADHTTKAGQPKIMALYFDKWSSKKGDRGRTKYSPAKGAKLYTTDPQDANELGAELIKAPVTCNEFGKSYIWFQDDLTPDEIDLINKVKGQQKLVKITELRLALKKACESTLLNALPVEQKQALSRQISKTADEIDNHLNNVKLKVDTGADTETAQQRQERILSAMFESIED